MPVTNQISSFHHASALLPINLLCVNLSLSARGVPRMTRIHVRVTTFLFAFLAFSFAAAGQTCHFGDSVGDEKALRAAHTCQAAYKQYMDCRWGSSADGWRGAIVREKCEPLFLTKLTAERKKVYNDKLHFCGQQYELASGTLAISESNTCGVEVIFEFATDSVKASKPLPFASFDCSLARTPIEKTICSNSQLGRADLLLSTAYKPFFNAVKGNDRAKLIAKQRAWNASIPLTCHLNSTPATQATISCLIEAYKTRADLLNQCSNGLEVDCLDTADESKPQPKTN
jgi:uncharacterized protein YecT (DUF1311 family)